MKIEELETHDAEEWLRKFHEIISRRRQVMYRFVSESVRLFVLGNGGGVALVMGLLNSTTRDESLHFWLLVNMLIFVAGVLMAGLTTLLVTVVAIREAHEAEDTFQQFIKGELDREDALFDVGKQTRRWANIASIWGILAAIALGIGGSMVFVLLALFF